MADLTYLTSLNATYQRPLYRLHAMHVVGVCGESDSASRDLTAVSPKLYVHQTHFEAREQGRCTIYFYISNSVHQVWITRDGGKYVYYV